MQNILGYTRDEIAKLKAEEIPTRPVLMVQLDVLEILNGYEFIIQGLVCRHQGNAR